MANNRMYLKHEPSGKKILLAKYYPSVGWYFYQSQETMDEWLGQFLDGSMWGDTEFSLHFETKEGELS